MSSSYPLSTSSLRLSLWRLSIWISQATLPWCSRLQIFSRVKACLILPWSPTSSSNSTCPWRKSMTGLTSLKNSGMSGKGTSERCRRGILAMRTKDVLMIFPKAKLSSPKWDATMTPTSSIARSRDRSLTTATATGTIKRGKFSIVLRTWDPRTKITSATKI